MSGVPPITFRNILHNIIFCSGAPAYTRPGHAGMARGRLPVDSSAYRTMRVANRISRAALPRNSTGSCGK